MLVNLLFYNALPMNTVLCSQLMDGFIPLPVDVKNWHTFGDVLGWTLVAFALDKLLYRHTAGRIGVRYFFTSLLVLCFWQSGCAQLETIGRVQDTKQPVKSACEPNCLSIAIQRLQPPKLPPQGLPKPSFEPQGGKIAYGTSVRLSASSMPIGAVLEYSYDNGKTWTEGNQMAAITKTPVLARTRINDLVSQMTQATFSPYFQRMFVVGNSIMNHAPAPNLGWFNFNGMAASARDKDFVHLLDKQLTTIFPQATFRLQSGGGFERNFVSYNLDEFNAPLQEFKPDLIVVRIGENVNEGDVSGTNFEQAFERLLNRLVQFSGPAKVVCTTSVWNRPRTNQSIRNVVARKGYALAEVSVIEGKGQYFAAQYADPGVAAHPNDAGMQVIADLIWEQIQK